MQKSFPTGALLIVQGGLPPFDLRQQALEVPLALPDSLCQPSPPGGQFRLQGLIAGLDPRPVVFRLVAGCLPQWFYPGVVQRLAERLRRVGIRPREMRNAARAQLAAEIPPAMLAHILGINAQTAVAWAAVSGWDWMTYAGSRQP